MIEEIVFFIEKKKKEAGTKRGGYLLALNLFASPYSSFSNLCFYPISSCARKGVEGTVLILSSSPFSLQVKKKKKTHT